MQILFGERRRVFDQTGSLCICSCAATSNRTPAATAPPAFAGAPAYRRGSGSGSSRRSSGPSQSQVQRSAQPANYCGSSPKESLIRSLLSRNVAMQQCSPNRTALASLEATPSSKPPGSRDHCRCSEVPPSSDTAVSTGQSIGNLEVLC